MERIRDQSELYLIRDELSFPTLLLQHGRTDDVLANVRQRPSSNGVESTSTHDVTRACALATVKETARGFRYLRKATAVLTEIVVLQDVVGIVRRTHESDGFVFDEVWNGPRKPIGFGDHVRVERGEILRRAIVGCCKGKTRAYVAGLVVMALTRRLLPREVHDVLTTRFARTIRAVEIFDSLPEFFVGGIVQNKDPEPLGRILLHCSGCHSIHDRCEIFTANPGDVSRSRERG